MSLTESIVEDAALIPSLLAYNAALVVSDGLQARMGSLSANQEWFKTPRARSNRWNTNQGFSQ